MILDIVCFFKVPIRWADTVKSVVTMRQHSKLTVADIRNAKPMSREEKPNGYKMDDGGGLYLMVLPSGTKSWRYDYSFSGKRKTLALGTFPALSLADARKKHLSAKQQLLEGNDPASDKQTKKKELAAQALENAVTFGLVAEEWFKITQSKNAERTRQTAWGRIKLHILPVLGKKPMSQIELDDLVNIVRNLENQKKYPMAVRVSSLISQICRYARLRKYTQYNVADGLNDLREKRPDTEKKELPAITDAAGVADMLRKVWFKADCGALSPYMAVAMKLFCYLPQRSQEILEGTWDEIDLENGYWYLAAERMKARKEHDIPLSRQVLDLLGYLANFRTSNKHLFPSGNKLGHIRGESVNKNMHAAGIPLGQMTLHGWRKVFSTLAHEAGCPAVLVEKSLAHVTGNAVALAYNKAEYVSARAILMQWWADMVDALREGTALPKLSLDRATMFA